MAGDVMARPNSLGLDAAAYAIRPTRLVGEDIRYYEAVVLRPDDPWGGCERQLRTLRATGHLRDDDSGCLLDILSVDGSIVQDFRVTLRGLRHLVRTLKLKRDREREG